MTNNETKEKDIYNIIEYAIEFAWLIKENSKISRAEHRHFIADKVVGFIREVKNIPKDDIDEFIKKYLNK